MGSEMCIRDRPGGAVGPEAEDVRTHAFSVPPAGPRTPDEQLAAGNAAAALTGYDDGLSREPGDPHLLAGWIVARAALARDPGARRLLARPELIRPAPGR